MLNIILLIIFGLGIAFFATQNTQAIILNFMDYRIPNIPVYMVVIVSLLLGLFIGWLLNMVNAFGTFFTIRGKESVITKSNHTIEELNTKIHGLELENARLKGKTEEHEDVQEPEEALHHPRIFKHPLHTAS